MTINDIIDKTLAHEGGYSNNSKDPGGETNWGITKAVAIANGYTGNMKDLTREFAINIYKREYFDKPSFDLVYPISNIIAQELFDTSVNMGTVTAVKFLQDALNLLNRNQYIYDNIPVDGKIGSKTINTLSTALRYHNEALICKTMNGLQFMRYVEIVRNNPSQEEFIKGWILNRINM